MSSATLMSAARDPSPQQGVMGAGTQLRGAAAFPQNFAEKGERTDLADYQFWHSICVECKRADKVASLLFS